MKKDKTMKTTKMTGGIETQVAAGGPSKHEIETTQSDNPFTLYKEG
jgi:hypothetical protein